MNRLLSKLTNNCQFVLVVVVLSFASIVVWQISFSANESKVNDPSKDNIPNGFKWVDEQFFGYLYPEDWPEAEYQTSPAETAVLQTVQHPPLLYDRQLDIWVVAEDSEDFSEGEIYNGLAVARRERGLTVYEAGFADNNCGYSLYVFPSDSQLVQFRLPTFCFNSNEAQNNSDSLLFTQEVFEQEQEVLFSITTVQN